MIESTGFIEVPGSNCRMQIGELAILGKDTPIPGLVEDPSVDDRHARIELKESGYILRDLRSRAGTYLNNSRICEAWLEDGDEIRLGSYVVYFTKSNSAKDGNPRDLLSKNSEWDSQLEKLPSVSESEFPVLLLGPSGTGKEVLAEQIHKLSGRRGGPLVRVNCCALTETLIESELFGHVKGSFTGAISDRKGAFEAARGGTLFLDEIGDLSYGIQAKLLRALENREIRAVGADRTIQTDVRIVAATHQNLTERIALGTFRKDLFYRLNVIVFLTPSLADRMEDFEDLLYSFARQIRVRFSHGAIQKLKAHPWPGNIRELRNLVARASALFPRRLIEEAMISEILDPLTDKSATAPHTTGDLPVIKEIERQMIVKRLAANNGNQRRTAADLGMPKSTLNDRLRAYRIDPNLYSHRTNRQGDSPLPSI